MKYEPLIEKNVLFKPSRIRSLYSNFNEMIYDNPEGYEANIDAWVNLIGSIMSHEKIFILDTANLIEDLSFRCNGMIYKPLSLDCVLSEMINCGKLTDSQSILAGRSSCLFQRGLNWIFGNSKVFPESLIENSEKSGNYLKKKLYIYNATFAEYEEAIVRKMRSCYNDVLNISDASGSVNVNNEDSTNIIVTEEMFNNILEETRVEYKYYDVVKQLITSDNKALKVENYNGEKLYVRFSENADEQDKEKAKMIFEMNVQIKKTNSKVDTCNLKIQEYDTRLRTLISSKANKEVLKTILRMKKNMESSISKLMSNLSNLEILLAGINVSTDNLKYLNVVSSSNNLLKRLNSEAAADINIDNLMDDVHYNIDQVKEINDKLKIDVNDNAEEQQIEEEIDEELAKLEISVKEENNDKNSAQLKSSPETNNSTGIKDTKETQDAKESENAKKSENALKDGQDLIERFEKLKVSPKDSVNENVQTGKKPQEETKRRDSEKQPVTAT